MIRKSGKQSPVTSEDINSYVDGHLTADRVQLVENYLAENPTEAARVADYRAINHTLGNAFSGVIEEPIPTELLDAVHSKHSFRLSQIAVSLAWPDTGLGLRIAASIVWLTGGIGFGWVANTSISPSTDAIAQLTQKAQTAYTVYSPEELHPVEVGAGQSDHLSSWLSNRLGRNVPIPSLMDLGYTFLGGRLLTGYQQPAAMLMYQNTDGQRLILYVSTEFDTNKSAPMEFEHSPNAGVVTWAREGTGYGVAGGFSEEELMPAANLIRAQISI